MTTTTLEETTAQAPPPVSAPEQGARPFPLLRHSLVLAGRAVRKIRRTPEQFIDVTLQPIIFVVLFVYIFGGAVSGSTHDYLQYVLPAIMVQTVLFSSLSIGVNLNTDIKKGVFDRFRSLPIARSAPLIGAVSAEVVRFGVSVIVLMGFGYVLGFRIGTDPLSALAGCLLAVAFALCVSWIAVFLGTWLRESGAVQGIGFLVMFPLTFGSNMFVPTASLPGWLQAWVKINPVTHLTDAIRGLLVGGPVAGPVGWSVLTGAIILAVFAPLAVTTYRRKTN
ncbi:MAG TPA: ABC transporter permease [Mycobacteriales bacterium]|nr:ABC transporter permease [Mycobacteriales bacterium]